jgi:hypothetical protein
MSIRSPPEAPCDKNTNRLAVVLRAGMQADAKGGGALPSLGRLSVCETGPQVKRDADGNLPPRPKLEKRTKQVLTRVLMKYVGEIGDTGMTLPGTNFDLDAGTHASLMSYASSRGPEQFKVGIRGQLPFLKPFEREMVEMGMVVYSKYDSNGPNTGVFIFSARKLKTLAAKARNFDFAMKSLLWVLSHIPNNELVGEILDAEDNLRVESGAPSPVWHVLLAKYEELYDDAAQYCETISEERENEGIDTDINTSGMFDAEIDVRFLQNLNSLDKHSLALDLARPSNRPLKLHEQALKNGAMEVEKLILSELTKINEARKQETPPSEPLERDQMPYEALKEILVDRWETLVDARRVITKQLRRHVNLRESAYYTQPLQFQVAAPAAQPM